MEKTLYTLTANGFEKHAPAAPQKIGSRIYGFLGLAGSESGVFAVIGEPNQYGVQKLVEIGGLHRFTTLDYQYCRPISQKFGIGMYWDDKEPDYRFSQEEIDQAIREAEEEKERARIEAERAAEESRQAQERYKKEYDYLTPCEGEWRDIKTAVNNIRKVLKHDFPGQKFSVRTKNYDTVYICWVDGPVTEEVERRIGAFQGKTFDGMTDSEESVSNDFNAVFGSVGYLFTTREMSDGVRNALRDEVLADIPGFPYDRDMSKDELCRYLNGQPATIVEKYMKISRGINWISLASLVRFLFAVRDYTPTTPAVSPIEPIQAEGVEIVDYSEKAVAVFGDTKAIKDTLKQLGGRFNRALSRSGQKCAGWIFSKTKEAQLREALGIAG